MGVLEVTEAMQVETAGFVSALPEGNTGGVGPCRILLHPRLNLVLQENKTPGPIGRPVYLGHKSKCRSFGNVKSKKLAYKLSV